MTTTTTEITTPAAGDSNPSLGFTGAGVTQEALMALVLCYENPRAYVASVAIAFHYDPDSGLSKVNAPLLADAMDRSVRQAVRYKGADSTVWDLVSHGPTGNTYRLTGSAEERLEQHGEAWAATQGRCAVLRPDMLGDGTQWDNTARFGVDTVVEAEYDFLSPAARVNRAGVVGGPVMGQFVASLQHRSQSDGALLGKLLWDLDPRQGASEVNRDELLSVMRLGHMKSLERKVRVLARETGLVEVTHTDTGYRVTPSEMFCAAWDTWANRR